MRGTQSCPWRPPHSGCGFPPKTETELISQPFTSRLLALKDKGCARPGHKHCPRSEVSGGDVFENLLFPTVRAVSAFPGPPRRGTETGHMHPLDLLGPWGAHSDPLPLRLAPDPGLQQPGLIPSTAQLSAEAVPSAPSLASCEQWKECGVYDRSCTLRIKIPSV